MNTQERIKKTISEIEIDIEEIKRELDSADCHNRSGKLQSIRYAKEMILDFNKVLGEMINGK